MSDQQGAAGDVDLATATPGFLDSLPLGELFQSVYALEQRSAGRLPALILSKLDQVYQVKLVRILGKGQPIRAEALGLDDHLGRVVSEDNAEFLDAMPEKYATRWGFLRDLLATALEYRDSQAHVAEASTGAAKRDLWELIARKVLESGPGGIPWQAVVAELQGMPGVAQSKASMSVLLSNLVAAGWVETRVDGREKHLLAGSRIAEAQAYQRAFQSGRAEVPRSPASPAELENSPWGRAVTLLREYMCFSQGRLIEYFHLSTALHKAIRLSLPSEPSQRPSAKTKLALGEFIGYMNAEFKYVANETFKTLARHFERRSGSRPRICLKGSWSQRSGENGIVDILRDSAVAYDSPVRAVADNTGFHEISSTGAYFLANDLPRMALRGEYHNPRIDARKLGQIRDRLRKKEPTEDLQMNHEQWISCWTDAGRDHAEPSRFYRSTLIIPCTIWNNSLSERFWTQMQGLVPEEARNSDVERMILGYLCIDHVDANYFDQQLDVNVGYVMADALTIFLMMRWLLTTGSRTYGMAEKMGAGFKVIPPQSAPRPSLPPPDFRQGRPLTLEVDRHLYVNEARATARSAARVAA